ncbi:hypothetical protein [Exiguobacterium mexicanum]|uniref:hypothetical protein n=1 Tax=Exiguobacterium mexicanum TaxID=340146 RepID=UPI0037C009F8
MKLSIDPGDYVVLIEINKEVLKCTSLDQADYVDRDRYELVGRMSERLPAEVIVPSIIDYIRFGSGYIGDNIVWDKRRNRFSVNSSRRLTALRSVRTSTGSHPIHIGRNWRVIIRI